MKEAGGRDRNRDLIYLASSLHLFLSEFAFVFAFACCVQVQSLGSYLTELKEQLV